MFAYCLRIGLMYKFVHAEYWLIRVSKKRQNQRNNNKRINNQPNNNLNTG